jgi:hypothetical protein
MLGRLLVNFADNALILRHQVEMFITRAFLHKSIVSSNLSHFLVQTCQLSDFKFCVRSASPNPFDPNLRSNSKDENKIGFCLDAITTEFISPSFPLFRVSSPLRPPCCSTSELFRTFRALLFFEIRAVKSAIHH